MEKVRKDILIRAYLIYTIVLICGFIIVYRIFSLVYVQGREYREMASDNNVIERVLEAQRGNIYSEDGSLIATSVPVFDLYWDSRVVERDTFYNNINQLAKKLSIHFKDKSSDEYKKLFIDAYKKKLRYMPIKRSEIINEFNQVTYSDLKVIREFPIFRLGKNIGGLIIEKKDIRKMPFKNLATRTIGYQRIIEYKNGKKDSTFVGLEGGFNSYLEGINGKRIEQKIRGGVWVPVSEENQIEPQNGKDVYTTLNMEFQRVATNALYNQLEISDAEHGCVILMEVETGYIRAISNLRRRKDGSYGEDLNYAIWESAEPGSTFKLASLIAILEEGKLDTNSIVPTGTAKYNKKEMKDSHEEGYGNITLKRAFELSSNVGISNAIIKTFAGNEGRYTDLIKKMGFASYFQLEIQGEGVPAIKDPRAKRDNMFAWSPTTLPWMSIGYELQITPLHILALYNTVANNGKLMKPQFVTEVKETDQTILKKEPIVLIEKICSEKTLNKAKSCLEGVVINGTAKNLFNTVYSIAGKTGTAQIAKKGGYGNEEGSNQIVEYKASFVGYFPAENPKYSCIVVINNPKAGSFYGGEIAAPVFKQIADKVYALQSDIKESNEDDKIFRNIPYIRAGYHKDLIFGYNYLDFYTYSSNLNSNWVSTKISKKKIIEMKPITFSNKYIPNVVGMSAKDAVYLLENCGITVVVEGRGLVSWQSISSGVRIKKDDKIKIKLSLPEIQKVQSVDKLIDTTKIISNKNTKNEKQKVKDVTSVNDKDKLKIKPKDKDKEKNIEKDKNKDKTTQKTKKKEDNKEKSKSESITKDNKVKQNKPNFN